MIKTKGKIKLLQSSISVIEVRTPEIPDSNNIYDLDFSTFQLPEGVILLDVMHHVDHKMPRTLKVLILSTNNTISMLVKNSPIVALVPAGKCGQVQEIKWSVLQDAKWAAILEVTLEPETTGILQKAELMPEIPGTTSLQLQPETQNVSKSIPDVDILEIARKQFQELLDVKYNSIVSTSATEPM